jgi:hypothetical protein
MKWKLSDGFNIRGVGKPLVFFCRHLRTAGSLPSIQQTGNNEHGHIIHIQRGSLRLALSL